MSLVPALGREAKVDGSLDFYVSLVYITNSGTTKTTKETLCQKKEMKKQPLLLLLFFSCDVGSQTQGSTQAEVSGKKYDKLDYYHNHEMTSSKQFCLYAQNIH